MDENLHRKQRIRYTNGEYAQMIGCAMFMGAIWIQLMMSMSQLSHGAAFHLFGFVSICVTYVFVDIACALSGKMPVSTVTEYGNVIQHYYALFEALTNIRDGEYYFHYTVCLEMVSIS